MRNVDLLIIGGGSAGMAAAIQARKDGVKDILIVEPFEHSGRLKDLLSGYHLSYFALSDDMNDWRNVSFARYYSIKGIKVLK